jgi:hypothetical protein
MRGTLSKHGQRKEAYTFFFGISGRNSMCRLKDNIKANEGFWIRICSSAGF